MSESVAVQMEKLMEQYGSEVREIVESSAKDAAEIAKNQLKSTSPRGSGSRRHYANGWAIKSEIYEDQVSFTVYNRSKPGLTHLLENGHAKRGGGRVRAIPHIAPAEEMGIKELEERIERALQ